MAWPHWKLKLDHHIITISLAPLIMLAVCAIKSKEQTIRKKMYPPLTKTKRTQLQRQMYPPAPPPLFKLVWHAAKPLVALPALDLLLIGHFAENCFFSVWQICVFRNGIKRFLHCTARDGLSFGHSWDPCVLPCKDTPPWSINGILSENVAVVCTKWMKVFPKKWSH